MTNLRAQFDREVDRSARGVVDAIAPYTRFVRAEHDKLTSLAGDEGDRSALAVPRRIER